MNPNKEPSGNPNIAADAAPESDPEPKADNFPEPPQETGEPKNPKPQKEPESPPLTAGQSGFLRLFGAKRFKTPAQREAVLVLEKSYGTGKLLEAAAWAAKIGMPVGKAVASVETALPTWGQNKRKKEQAGSSPEPKGYAGIREWLKERNDV